VFADSDTSDFGPKCLGDLDRQRPDVARRAVGEHLVARFDGTVAAASKETFGGIGVRAASGTATYSAQAPEPTPEPQRCTTYDVTSRRPNTSVEMPMATAAKSAAKASAGPYASVALPPATTASRIEPGK
jgi:hypothetical protein